MSEEQAKRLVQWIVAELAARGGGTGQMAGGLLLAWPALKVIEYADEAVSMYLDKKEAILRDAA